jgi:GNAT superfamily N-acetyltransferase
MEIMDLAPGLEPLYCRCLANEGWPWQTGVARKEAWYRELAARGLSVKLARDENGTIGGMIQYAPTECSFTELKGAYFVYCIWIPDPKKGTSLRGRGIGKALLAAAEADVRQRKGKGLAVWGMRLPFWMKASWFKKQGYRPVDRLGMAVLLWKPFTPDAEAPRWDRPRKLPELLPGRVVVAAFTTGWCPVANTSLEYARQAASRFPGRVVYREYNTRDPAVLAEWGMTDTVLLDGKPLVKGPPLAYETIEKKIAARVKRLQI